jgi:cbb3-type cytochrome c oxidase subunit III
LRRALAAIAALAAPFALAACGAGGVSKGAADVSHGKSLFSSKCSGCHTLKDANAHGNIGPNLDAAFGPARGQGFKSSTIRQIVNDQIKYPTRGSGMPANLVKGADRDDVAAYVAQCAGSNDATLCPGTKGGGQSNNGKTIFTSNCGSCHTLKDAGTHGNVGPNLDQLKPPFATVQHQVINGGGAMPAFKGQLTDKQIKSVAKYVSSVAGK